MKSQDFRICAVRVYEYMGSMRKAAKAVKTSPASISRWSKDIDHKKHPVRGSKFVGAAEAAIKLALDRQPFTTARQLRSQMLADFGIDASRQLISLVIRKRLGYSWKRTRKRGPRNKGWPAEKVEDFKARFRRAYLEGTLSSWDESSFDMRSKPIYGYARRGEQAILHVPPPFCSQKHHSLLMAVHMDGSKHLQVSTGSTKAERFAEFILAAPFRPGTSVLLDNHSIHKALVVRAAAARKGYTLLFNPAYSPQLNPIEMVFGITKNVFYRERYNELRPSTDMPAFIEECVAAAATPRAVANCFGHVFRKYVDA